VHLPKPLSTAMSRLTSHENVSNLKCLVNYELKEKFISIRETMAAMMEDGSINTLA
jgi:hypothetical protein